MASESSTTPGETARRRRKERKEEKKEKEERKERKEKEKEEKETQTEDIEGLTSSGHRALQEGRTQDALQRFRRALKAARQLQDMRAQRACSLNLGAVYVETGRPRRGLELLQRAQPGPKAERLPDLQFNLALAHNALGQHREAATHFLQAAQLYRSQGDGGSEGDACMEMSRCYAAMQDWALAARGFLRAADGYRVAAMLDRAAAALQAAGRHMTQSDEFSRDNVIAVLTDCLSLTDSVTEPRTLGELYLSVGVAYCCLRCFPEAVSCLRRAEALASPWRPLLAQVLLNLGAALNSDRQFTAAVDIHRRAAALYGSLACRGDQARCFSNLAFACSQLGDEDEAAESFVLALHGFRDTDDHVAQVEVCEALAECYLRQKKQHKAVQLYQQALTAAAAAATVGQDDGGRVRGRLVERLTAALAPPSGPQQRPRPQRPRPPRPRPQDQGVRKSDIAQSPGPAANQQREAQRGRGQAAEAAGRQEAAEHCGSAQGGDADGPTPHSPHLSDQTQHSELWSDRENPPTDSETSLVQEPEAPPPVRRRWRSRFCSLM